jgi:hypothetical protein
MAASTITFADKAQGVASAFPANQKLTFGDANEIKTVINANATILDTAVLQDEDFIDVNNSIANPTHKEGRVFYDQTKKALSYYNDETDTTVNLAQELLIRVINESGGTIENGSIVRVDGASTNLPEIVKALADTVANSNVIGMVTHDILDTETGYVTVLGSVGSLDTSTETAGDFVYLSETTAGEWTTTKPAITAFIGIVLISHATTGEIMIVPEHVEVPVAIGQSSNTPSHAQALTTTPAVLQGYSNTPFEKNVTITATAAGGSYRAILAPESAAQSGFYEINFTMTVTSSANQIVIAELYKNGSATGLIGKADFTSNNTDEGTIVLSVFSETAISDSDTLEMYIYTAASTTTVTIEVIVFNMKRLGSE